MIFCIHLQIFFAILMMVFIFVTFVADDLDDALKAYRNGECKEAAKLFKKTYYEGHASSCSNIGNLYEDGENVKKTKQST
jgi:TPR repeat protein